MNIKFTLVFVAATLALVQGYGHDEDNGQAHYRSEYGVNDPHTHDIRSQYEERNGHHVLGGYNLREPDGTIRVVKYRAGPHAGYEAEAERVGHAQHPGQYAHGYGGYASNSFDGEAQGYHPGYHGQDVVLAGADGNQYPGQYVHGYGGYASNSFDGEGQGYHPGYYGQDVVLGGAAGNGYGYGQGQVNSPGFYENQYGQGHGYGGAGGVSYVGPVH